MFTGLYRAFGSCSARSSIFRFAFGARSVRPTRAALAAAGALAAVVLLAPSAALAGPRWMLIYYRQIGNHVDGGTFSVENHLFRENGTRGAGVGVTNQFNLGTAIWGFADADGWRRIDPDTSAYRDVRIYDPGVPSDQTPNFYHFNPNYQFGKYSFETHWLYVSDDSQITAYPTTPVYHYDLVDGINSSTYVEPPGTNSDEFSLTTWTQPIYQTFVVPAGINRIITVKAWAIKEGPFRAVYSIHADNGGPISSWPRIGPEKMSRVYHSTEFMPVTTNFALNDVPVTPGQRYALKVRPEDNQGFNSYATNNDNYAQGHLYLGDVPITDRDMVAVVVGVGVGPVTPPPTISRSPASFTRSINAGQNASSNQFTIANSGGGTLNYSITDDVAWLSVSPTSGSATTETDTITINYNTASLTEGEYTATITLSATGATNTPQTIAVNLTVASPYAPVDHDEDGDVDLEDFGWFQTCFSGPGIPQNQANCLAARLDNDEDVDASDLDLFRQCMTGPNNPASPDCAG